VTGFTAIAESRGAETLASLNILDLSWKKHFTWNEPFFIDSAPHSPGVTMNSYGKGRAIFIASPIYSLLNGRYDPIIADLTETLVSMSAAPAEIRLDAPPNVYMSLRKHDDFTDIHLVDITGLKSPVVDYIGVIENVSIRLNRPPVEVRCVTGNENITVAGNVIILKRLHIHECVSVRL
jgi:hypothetical protein